MTRIGIQVGLNAAFVGVEWKSLEHELDDCVAMIARAGSAAADRLLERTIAVLLPARPNIVFVCWCVNAGIKIAMTMLKPSETPRSRPCGLALGNPEIFGTKVPNMSGHIVLVGNRGL